VIVCKLGKFYVSLPFVFCSSFYLTPIISELALVGLFVNTLG